MDVDVESQVIGHLGIVAGIFDTLNIAEVIDKALPKKSSRNLPHSVVVKAMILNGLGFVSQRLYMFPNFFQSMPTEMLLGKGITASDLNDDIVGRTLDGIFRCGPTELFNGITLQIMKQFSLGTQLLHVDTTNFSLHGKYEGDAPDGTDSIEITFGHAKDGRTDLKRFVLGLITNQNGLPLFSKAFSGNESDKKSIVNMITEMKKSFDFDNDCYWIADSALYTKENIQLLGTETKWITRIPSTVGEVERLLNTDLVMIPGTDPKYAFYATDLNYGEIPQRAVVVWSDEMRKRDEKTFDKAIQKESATIKKELKKLKGRKFVCVPDAENEANVFGSVYKYHQLKNIQVFPVLEKVEKKRGRPKKDEPLNQSFKIEAEIDVNEGALVEARKKFGRFVLASNQTDLEPEVMLNYYKGQQNVERGFRFLKDKNFHVSNVYLKKEERIESLCMIMALSLLIYSFAEWQLRKKLKETGQTVPNQINKPTQRPTMRWIFQMFIGVIQSSLISSGMVLKTIVHLTDSQTTVITLLGNDCKKYYGLE